MKINRLGSKIKEGLSSRSPRAKAQARKAQREFNLWAWEQNRQGRQAPLGA